jgi:hypothetical protein
MSDDLFKLCIVLVIFSIIVVAIVTITYFTYKLLGLGEQRPKPRAYSRQASPQNINQARQRRANKPTQNPYRNLPLDNQTQYKPKPTSKPKPEPVPKPVIAKLPAPPKSSSSSVPDSIDLKSLEKLRKRKTARPIAVNRGAPHEVLQLLRSDRAVANRLFAHVSSMNPGESEKWCWDKVVWDLERDRH